MSEMNELNAIYDKAQKALEEIRTMRSITDLASDEGLVYVGEMGSDWAEIKKLADDARDVSELEPQTVARLCEIADEFDAVRFDEVRGTLNDINNEVARTIGEINTDIATLQASTTEALNKAGELVKSTVEEHANKGDLNENLDEILKRIDDMSKGFQSLIERQGADSIEKINSLQKQIADLQARIDNTPTLSSLVKDALKGAVNKVQTAVLTFKKNAINAYVAMKDGVIKCFEGFKENIKDFAEKRIENAKDFGDAIKNTAKGACDAISNRVTEARCGIIEKCLKAVDDLSSKLANTKEGLENKLESLENADKGDDVKEDM